MNEIQQSTLNSHTNTYAVGDRSTLEDDHERYFGTYWPFRQLKEIPKQSNVISNEQIEIQNTNDKTTITENFDYTYYYTETNNLDAVESRSSVLNSEEVNFVDAVVDARPREMNSNQRKTRRNQRTSIYLSKFVILMVSCLVVLISCIVLKTRELIVPVNITVAFIIVVLWSSYLAIMHLSMLSPRGEAGPGVGIRPIFDAL